MSTEVKWQNKYIERRKIDCQSHYGEVKFTTNEIISGKLRFQIAKKILTHMSVKMWGKEGEHNKNKRRMAIERGLKRKINLLLKPVTLSTISLI